MQESAFSPQATLQAALACQNAGSYDQALGLFRECLAADPGNLAALFGFGALTAGTGDLDGAIEIYEKILAIVPQDTDALCNIGHIRQLQGRVDEAAASYEQALARNPLLPAANVNYGNILIASGQPENAESHYRTALKVDPRNAQAQANLGVALFQQGKAEDAITAFRQAAEHSPDDPETLANLANVLSDVGQHEEALQYYRKAAALRPDWPRAHFNLAILLSRTGDTAEAEKHYRQTVALQPDHVDALTGLAFMLQQEDRIDDADPFVDKLAEIGIRDAGSAFNLGTLFRGRRDWDQAAEYYTKALELDDSNPDFFNNLGATLHSAERFGESIEILERGLKRAPDNSLLWNSLGNSLSSDGNKTGAADAYRRALEIDPDFEMAANNLSNALREAGRLDEAHEVIRHYLKRMPDSAHLHNCYGLVFHDEHRNEESIPYFEKAIELKRDYFEARNNLAMSHQAMGRYHRAIEIYRDILAEKPVFPEVLFNLGNVLQVMGRYDESITVFRQALTQRADYRMCYPYLVHALMYTCNWTNLDASFNRMIEMAREDIATGRPLSLSGFELLSTSAPMELRYEVARDSAKRTRKNVRGVASRLDFTYRGPAEGRLRIGYVSPDFRFHSVAVAFKDILANHDRNDFEFCGYSLAPVGKDGMTRYFADNFDRFHDISNLPLEDATRLINGDGINILIDLAGPTRFSQPGIFALQPAPIQAHYLGYSCTVGGDFIQYLITDHQQVAPGMEKYFAEKLVYLPDTFMATTKSEIDPRPVERAGWRLPEKGFVFANFNSHYKFDPRMFSIWMRLLKRIPGSVLWLISGTPVSQANLRREAQTRGISPDRLIFADTVVHEQHLARQKLVDLALDNQYHGGGVTTVDALWVGVPVLTVAGQAPPSRNGATLLHAVGLDEMITHSLDEYESKAFTLATDPVALAAVKAKLAANCDTNPLFDTARLARHLERAYRLMWDNHEAGNEPRAIEVPALPREDNP